MAPEDREKYPEIAKVMDLKATHGEAALDLVQEVIEYMFDEYVITDVTSDYPTSKTREQVVYEFWGVDYEKFKKQYDERFDELLENHP